MAGTKGSSDRLNFTLEYISNVLNASPINDWFIAFGTLLGIARNNSCIDGDDDIDINIACDYDLLKNILIDHNLTLSYSYFNQQERKIIKTVETDALFHSIDFYFCDVNDHGDFHCHWEHCTWRNSYENLQHKRFIQKPWRSTVLNLPNNYTEKLTARYGDWRTPSDECRGGDSCHDLP